MSPSYLNPASHHELKEIYYTQYDNGVANGTTLPFVYPMGSLGATVVLLFLLVPPRSIFHSQLTRYAAFGFIFSLHVFMITNCKARNVEPAFGVGLICAWGVLWSAAILVFNDAKVDYKRIVRKAPVKQAVNIDMKDDTKWPHLQLSRTVSFKGSPPQNGRISSSPSKINSKDAQTKRTGTLAWQIYPDSSFVERADWVVDLYSNFRGVAWNWKIPGLPTYPNSVQAQLQSSCGPGTLHSLKDFPTSRSGVCRFDTSRDLILHNIWLFTKGYLIIDLVLTLMHYDPYFWGIMNRPPPAYFPVIIANYAVLIRAYRLVFSMTMVWMCLRTVFCLAPLFFVGVLGPKYIGVHGEPWMYPDHFGSYQHVFDRGLAGWWSSWWHSTFRSAFQAGADWAVIKSGLHPKSMRGKALQLFVAFSLSGCLHASGSMTMAGETWPWRGAFMFFFWQPVGILLEMSWGIFLKQSGLQRKIPKPLGQAANFLWVHAWFLLTGPLIADDFARYYIFSYCYMNNRLLTSTIRGGLWLFEPFPVSLARLVGLGVEGDKFWCWNGRWAQWHTDKNRWWFSGIAL